MGVLPDLEDCQCVSKKGSRRQPRARKSRQAKSLTVYPGVGGCRGLKKRGLIPSSKKSDGEGRMRIDEKARGTTAGSQIAGGIGKAIGIRAGNLMDIVVGRRIDIK